MFIKQIFDDLSHLLKCTNKSFDITAVSNTRLSKKTYLTSNANLKNYSFESTPTESTVGGTIVVCIINYVLTLICIKKHLESTFTELINSKKNNIVVGCFHNHPNMDALDFNSLINQQLDKILKQQKQIFLLRDFTINLVKYNEHQPINQFLDSLASNSIIP